jgi:hypothetical protein
LRLGEGLVEIIGRQVERDRVERHQFFRQRLKRIAIGDDRLAEPRQVIGP